MRRSLKLNIVSAVVLAAGITATSAAPAQAAIYAGNGVWGYNAPATVTCRYLSAWGQLRTEVPPPVAYAYDRTAGGGNDWQQVRYRLFYVDPNTGQTLGASGWSGFAWAADNAPAQWSGVTHQLFPWRAHVRVDTRIEFYNRNGAYDGYTAHTADRTYYYNGYSSTGVGPLSWCARI